jgi:hypothetical protein
MFHVVTMGVQLLWCHKTTFKLLLILGKGNGFLTSLLFSSLKSVKNHTIPFFFG